MALPNTPIDDAHTLGSRIEAARVAHRDAQEIATKRAAEFRKVIVEALDAGWKQADVAAAAGISRARLHHILVSEYSRP